MKKKKRRRLRRSPRSAPRRPVMFTVDFTKADDARGVLLFIGNEMEKDTPAKSRSYRYSADAGILAKALMTNLPAETCEKLTHHLLGPKREVLTTIVEDIVPLVLKEVLPKMLPKVPKMLWLKIMACDRCGRDHGDLPFSAIPNPGEFKWWAICPTTKSPIFIKEREPSPTPALDPDWPNI